LQEWLKNVIFYPGCRKSIADKRWERDKEIVSKRIMNEFSPADITNEMKAVK